MGRVNRGKESREPTIERVVSAGQALPPKLILSRMNVPQDITSI